MAYRLNPITGAFDLVNIPLPISNQEPVMFGNGDVQFAVVNGDVRLYWQVNGKIYYKSAVKQPAAPISINFGQPIPVGMGLTFTYAGNVN